VKLPEIPEDQFSRSLQKQNNNGPRLNNPRDSIELEERDEVDSADLKSQQQWRSAAKPADKSMFYQQKHNSSIISKQHSVTGKSVVDGGSVNDNEIDGLLKWAKDLPDDVQLS